MFLRIFAIGAILAAALALYLQSQDAPPPRAPYIQGRNRTVLFIANKEHGLSNAGIATASALLEEHPDIEVHYATFAGMEGKLGRVSAAARVKNPKARDIIYHVLPGPSLTETGLASGRDFNTVIHRPGLAGIADMTSELQYWISPWTADEHLAVYRELDRLVDELDPGVISVDPIMRPGIDIARDRHRLHAILSPGTLLDQFMADQPRGGMLWKYPAIASGFTFPVPLHKIPENAYLILRFVYSAIRTPELAAKKDILRANGIKDPINFMAIYRSDVPWISMNTEGAAIPLEVIPPNVTCAGPMLLDSAPAADQDPELVAWMEKRPTVLVNLGSTVIYSEDRAITMVKAFAEVLEKTDVQLIWKFNKMGEYSDDFLEPVREHLKSGRIMLSNWLPADPYSLLQTGHIVASVHHGGSNCYHEAIAAGVPQLILPLWHDLYAFAALAELFGVGVWSCKETSPRWTADDLARNLLRVLDGGEEATSMREKAQALGEEVRSREKGRSVAARVLADLSTAPGPVAEKLP